MNSAVQNSDHAIYYLLPYTKDQLLNTSNFIDNAWLVNKFPDELPSLGDAMTKVRNTPPDEICREEVLSSLGESIKYRIQRLEFCIRILEEEREIIGLRAQKVIESER